MTPAKIAATRYIEVTLSGKMKECSEKRVRMNPASDNDKNPCSPRVKIWSAFGAARLARSLAANPAIPITASIEKTEKLSVPG
tara:strand:+ start:259 stop:507 length:249 start_codon:yes stop_codon:yes gene_type:complete